VITATPGVKLTYKDFVRFPDDGMRHELIDGEHYVTPSPNTRHQEVLGRLYLALAGWLEDHPIGRVFLAPFDVVFTPFDVVEPDLLYMSNERGAEILTAANVRGTPNLVIEIGSPGTRRRDAGVKKALYERAGVDEYWLVDPGRDLIRVFRRGAVGFAAATEWSARRRLTSPLLPGFVLSLERVFRLDAFKR
jgi:Uma2 family endonuclease